MSSRMSVFMLTVGVMCLLSMRVAADEVVNQKMLQYCAANINQKVGGGQCAHLVNAALQAA